MAGSAAVKKAILRDFDLKSEAYKAFGQKLQGLVEDLLATEGITVHSVSFRRKDRASLEKKLNKQGSTYRCLADVTDVCGLRVITYFEDEVKAVSNVLHREFKVDAENSVDKADSLDPDRFGYLSVHHVVSNRVDRNNLSEYKRYADLKAEIQVRSILQHAWAEIEHDLGYKSRDGIPKPVRRRFSRLAGLFELADQEFRTIREELSSYSNEVSANIETSPAEIEIDGLSLKAFVERSALVKRLDSKVAEILRSDLEADEDNEPLNQEAKRMAYFGIRTIDELQGLLERYEQRITRFAKIWIDTLGDFPPGTVAPSISLFYLAYLLAIESEKSDFLANYLSSFLGTENATSKFMEQLKDAYNQLEKT